MIRKSEYFYKLVEVNKSTANMVQLDLSEISSELIRSALCETIENQLKSKDYQINVSLASKVGETNFVGIVYRVSFQKNGDEKHDQIIVKVAPQNVARRIQFKSRAFFLREIHMYNEVLPFFRQFESSKGLTVEDGLNEYPKCFQTIDVELNESLIFEDLNARDMTIINKFTTEVSIDHARLVMQALGKLHAISFALKDQQPEKFRELSSELNEMHLNSDNVHIRELLNRQSEYIITNLLTAEEDAHVLDKIKTLFKREAIYIIEDCLDLKSVENAAVIIHGDVWQNNIMFRNDKNGVPIEMCFLDWQVSKHASPVIDIVYFLFCCTTKDLRDLHYEDLLKAYYDSLAAHTTRLGSNLQQLFPYALMQEHLRKFGKWGLVLAMMLLSVITADERGAINLDQLSEDMLNGKLSPRDSYVTENSRLKYNKRLRDVIVDMVRLGYV